MANSLAAFEAGADQVHGTALGVGERVGNTPIDQVLVNLVVDRDVEAGKQTLRGIFSASQIARQLGVDLSTHEFARTFAEIEAAFAGV